MHKYICIVLLLLIFVNGGFGAADYEVEQVKFPFVEKKDIGQMMESGHRRSSLQNTMQATSPIRESSYSNEGRKSGPCLSCGRDIGGSSSYSTGGGGGASGSSSYGSGSSYSYGSGSGFNHPLQSSSRHEFKNEQEFVNGQQVYDFHHEKKYQDGKLIDEKRHEKGPDDYGIHHHPSESSGYASVSSSADVSQTQGYGALPSSSYRKNNYHGGMHQGLGFEPKVDDFTQQFQSEVERMREDLRRKTFSLPAHQLPSSPTYGSSHRTEYRTQTKYVNGQPVYVYNEERKYKDGKLVHNVTEEKGPNDLGTSGMVASPSGPSSPKGDIYSGYREGMVRNQQHIPSSEYPANYPGSYSSYSSTSQFSDNMGTAYRPSTYDSSSGKTTSSSSYPSSSPTHGSSAYHTRHQTSTGYHPNLNERPHDRDNEETDDTHRQPQMPNSYGSPTHSSSAYRTRHQTSTGYNKNLLERPHDSDDDDADDTHHQPQMPNSYGSPYGPSLSQHTNNQYDYDSARSTHYSSGRPAATTPKPSHYGYGTGRESYAARENTYKENRHRNHNNKDVYRTQVNTYPHSNQPIKEESQSSYFDSKSGRERPDTRIISNRNRVHEVDQDQTSRTGHYRPTVQRTSHSGRQEAETRYGAPSYESRINETSRSYQPGTRVTSTSTREDESRRSSSSNYRTPGVSYRPGRYGADDDDDDEGHGDIPRHASAPTSHVGVPNYISGPEAHEKVEDVEEQERYDISPYDDVSEVNEAENKFDTNKVRFEEYPSHHRGRDSTDDNSRSHLYKESESRSREHSTDYGYQPRRVPHQEIPNNHPQQDYSIANSSRTDHRVTTVIPSRWVETRTTWTYVNGKMVSETQHHRYYENGMLIHENTTQRTRDEMRDEGEDVQSLDLSPSQLAVYGQSLPSSSHSQKHEIYEVKRFRNGHKTYELNHERQFQDGVLVLENKEEKDEDDFKSDGNFRVPSVGSDDHHSDAHHIQSPLTNQHLDVGRTELGASGVYHTTAGNPKTYTRKHEVRQEEEFVNGQKVYDFHHEREYEDGKLVRENKTELGPDDLGTPSGAFIHRDALKDLSGRKQSSVGESSLLEQRRTSDNVLSTSCLTCGTGHVGSTHTSGSATSGHNYNSESAFRQGSSTHTRGSTLGSMGSMGTPSARGYNSESTFRHDMEVEEHYENGQLVKGREENKKWRDGALVDANTKHYYDGPSRAGSISAQSSGVDSNAAFSSSPLGVMSHKLADKCAQNPCLNKGECKPSVRGPVCICPFGFKGAFCEEAYCPSRYCRYGGSCSVSGSKHVCQCLEGYSGYRCSTNDYRRR